MSYFSVPSPKFVIISSFYFVASLAPKHWCFLLLCHWLLCMSVCVSYKISILLMVFIINHIYWLPKCASLVYSYQLQTCISHNQLDNFTWMYLKPENPQLNSLFSHSTYKCTTSFCWKKVTYRYLLIPDFNTTSLGHDKIKAMVPYLSSPMMPIFSEERVINFPSFLTSCQYFANNSKAISNFPEEVFPYPTKYFVNQLFFFHCGNLYIIIFALGGESFSITIKFIGETGFRIFIDWFTDS